MTSALESLRRAWAGQGGVLRRSLARRATRAALATVALLVLVAGAADFLASDLPIALSLHGRVHVLPNVIRPVALRAYDNRRLLRVLAPDDWMIAPLVAWGANGHDLDAVLEAPSRRHWLGTDSGGRDVFARIVHGARVSLTVGVLSVAILSCIGLAVGVTAGYCRGWVDACLMRVVDALYAVPTLLLLITLLSVLRPSGYGAVLAMLATIGLVRWTDLARLVRAESLRVCATPYVEAARALGLSSVSVVVRHVLPNVVSPVLVAASFAMAASITMEGALSFLGFGVPDDVASWGGLLRDARDHVDAWWLAVFPGAVLFVSVSVYNVVGEALRDAFDPTLD
ncbi:MAG: ABC transporter permease [Polyangiales bacterium]